jgi:hypothetical protein
MKILRYIPILLVLGACQHAVSKTAHRKRAARLVDTMLLTKPGAVIIRPSSRQVDNMKKGQSDDDYDAVLDDDVWYTYQSEHYLDSLKTYKIDRESEGKMKFKAINGKMFTMKLDSLYFDIILFNGKDKPIHTDITDMETSYKTYMKK